MTSEPGHEVPVAPVVPARRLSPMWLVPLAALLLAVWLGWRAWSQRGLAITVEFQDGHALKAGDQIRYRGTSVGEVRDVRVAEDLARVVVVGSLHPRSRLMARGGSRFWVVRPEVGLDRVSGLETLMGPRYLAVLPGTGSPQRHFIGIEDAPPVEAIEPGDLEIILQATRRSGLRVGGPVLYRQVRVGTVLSVGLSGDAGAVEARLHIEKPYAPLARPETRFWPVRGVRATLDLGGLSVELDELQSLLIGGVALATPPGASPPVRTGHRFTLAEEPEDAWMEWDPIVAIGSDLLPAGAALPAPLRATIGWREGLFRSRRSRAGWVLSTGRGLLGPADLLTPSRDAREGSVVLEVAGAAVPLAAPLWSDGRLSLVAAEVGGPAWSMEHSRSPREPVDAVVVGDPLAPPVPLAAARLTIEAGAWRIDQSVALGEDWHGAAVLARSDGALIGLLFVGDDGALVAPLPDELP